MDKEPSSNKKLPTTYGLPKLREKVINVLEQAFIGNNLDSDDYEQRLVLAHAAQSVEELKDVIHDFPQKETLFPSTTVKKRPIASQIDTQQLMTPVQGLIRSIENADAMTLVGDCHVTTFDVNKPHIKVIRGIGNAVIDLRDIGYKYSHVRLEMYGLIGDVVVYVPMKANVQRKMAVLIGEKVQRVKGKAKNLFEKFFGKKYVAPRYNEGTMHPEVTIEIVGFNLVGNLYIQYCQD